MKKIINIVLFVTLIFILNACQKVEKSYLSSDKMISIISSSNQETYLIPFETNISIESFIVEDVVGKNTSDGSFEFNLIKTDTKSKRGMWYYLSLTSNFDYISETTITNFKLKINGIKYDLLVDEIIFYENKFTFNNEDIIYNSAPINLPNRDYKYNLTLTTKSDIEITAIEFTNIIDYKNITAINMNDKNDNVKYPKGESVILKEGITYNLVIELDYSKINVDYNASIYSDMIIAYHKEKEIRYSRVYTDFFVFDTTFSFSS